ncbi:ABC transporter permease [Anaerolinea thermophila]|uniref:Molybdenum ABC transporter permease protein n=1 Tax=Anaerolinea thermophila (strain DSM 14523 / JCM 11388 / NBRC 100420 / UNI-1) TaxID=926569 RepID=E8N3I0_ANATU|nr:ABC transporter permease [Anaerolinea thermophila]BAJ62994.1 molybdenum ABC transporter permease protein [Anaerolinea thermophila UNI-1]
MKKIWIVLKHEVNTLLHNRSFLLGVFLLPLLGFIVLFVVGLLQRNPTLTGDTGTLPANVEIDTKGLVDYSGIVREIPQNLKNTVKKFDGEESALQALKSGEISAFFVIHRDYLKNGKVDFFAKNINAFSDSINHDPVDWLIQYNLFKDRPELLQRVHDPFNLQEETLASKKTQRDEDDPLAFAVPYGVTMIFYVLIFGTSSLMLSNIATEKQNRVVEILLTSVTPTQMMVGKMLGLGIMGLFQTLIWLIAARLLLPLGGRSISILQGVQIPPEILGWGILYFLLGYAIYASMMAWIGALAPNLREASQVTFIVAIPLIIPLMFHNALIFRPDSTISVIFSLIPLTSPVAMMTRLAATTVPFWQLALAAVLQALTAWLVLRIAAGMFRAQNLLSGQAFNLKVFFKALLEKA